MESNGGIKMGSGTGDNPVPMQHQTRVGNPFGSAGGAGSATGLGGSADGGAGVGKDATTPKQNKNKKLTIILVTVAVVILAAVGGVLVWSKMNEDKASNNTGSNTDEEVDLDDDEPVDGGGDTPSDMEDEPTVVDDTADVTGSGIKNALISAFERSSEYSTSVTYNYQMVGIKYSGAYEGYMNANMSVAMSGSDGAGGGFGVVFYKTPSGEWQYFRSAQGAYVDCTEFDTDDLKKAFSGDTCWMADGSTAIVE